MEGEIVTESGYTPMAECATSSQSDDELSHEHADVNLSMVTFATSTSTLEWPNINVKIFSRIFSRLGLSNAQGDILLHEIQFLDQEIELPQRSLNVRHAEKKILEQAGFHVESLSSIEIPETNNIPHVEIPDDGFQFIHRDIFDLVLDLLGDAELAASCDWRFKVSTNEHGERLFGELNTSSWWEKMEQNEPDQNFLVFIFYSDATQITVNGRTAYPIYMTLGKLKFPTNQ